MSNLPTRVFCSTTTATLIICYKRGLLKTMLDRAYRLSSSWSYFSDECDRLRGIFFRIKYPQRLIISTIRDLVALKTDDQPPKPAPADSTPVRVVLPFKNQASADLVRKQLTELSQKIHTGVQPVFVGNKIQEVPKVHEKKPPTVNQQYVVYQFQCDLRDASYVAYTRRHLVTSAWANKEICLPPLANIMRILGLHVTSLKIKLRNYRFF